MGREQRAVRWVVLGVVVILAVALWPAAWALGSQDTARSVAARRPAVQTMRLTAYLLVGEEIDLGAPGRSVGDQFVFSGRLENASGKRVGRINGYCVISDLKRNAGPCTMTASLRGGQITTEGEQRAIPTPRTAKNAVTGGTGQYRAARGEVVQRFVTPPLRELTLRLTLQP